ncbi:MAG: hypothetical protein Q3976_02510 [Corynebacterium sp.]|nr:hypothetical protein [Corynebacterium sp.]
MKQPVYRDEMPAPGQPPNKRPQRPQDTAATPDAKDRPEVVSTYFGLWTCIITVEVLHQILNLVMSILSRNEMVYAIQQIGGAEVSELSDGLVAAAAIASATVMFLISLGFVAYMRFASKKVYIGGKKSQLHLRLLSFFAIYLVIRGLFVFFADPAGSLPIAFYAVDGCLRIAVGVAAALVVWAGNKRETYTWVDINIADLDNSAPKK